MHFYTWTNQCCLTRKTLYSLTLCGKWIPSRGLPKAMTVRVIWWKRESVCQWNPYYQYDLMMMTEVIFEVKCCCKKSSKNIPNDKYSFWFFFSFSEWGSTSPQQTISLLASRASKYYGFNFIFKKNQRKFIAFDEVCTAVLWVKRQRNDKKRKEFISSDCRFNICNCWKMTLNGGGELP